MPRARHIPGFYRERLSPQAARHFPHYSTSNPPPQPDRETARSTSTSPSAAFLDADSSPSCPRSQEPISYPQKGVRLDVLVAHDRDLEGDAERLAQGLYEVVMNAVKRGRPDVTGARFDSTCG